ncbi:hypothetical protein [Nocardiopsis aegyptia]|uniref:Uncharacterized protein n=1 Tax=Nocardiopsis aegyptia TaxID=220378 RepID=A0A7Z0EIC9_9ACTN|nr:hypothetical protein [Nocardiopsis aegyptia]NYJ32181.1 hypothetical protein [Nocardiopsis aegyptia]
MRETTPAITVPAALAALAASTTEIFGPEPGGVGAHGGPRRSESVRGAGGARARQCGPHGAR